MQGKFIFVFFFEFYSLSSIFFTPLFFPHSEEMTHINLLKWIINMKILWVLLNRAPTSTKLHPAPSTSTQLISAYPQLSGTRY